MSSPPSFSSAAIRTSDHIPDSLYPQHHQDHNTPSLSDVRSFDKSYSGNQMEIPYQPTDQPPSFQALARDQGNSHKNTDAASPGYYEDGQPPTVGSIENRNNNSEHSAAAGSGYEGYDLPPSRNHVAPRETSQPGTAAVDQNLPPQPYGQLSVTGRKIRKFEAPAYYTE